VSTDNPTCPGIIETKMWAYNDTVWGKLLGDYKPGELMAEWVEGIPMGGGVGCGRCRSRRIPGIEGCRLHHGADDQCRWWADHVLEGSGRLDDLEGLLHQRAQVHHVVGHRWSFSEKGWH